MSVEEVIENIKHYNCNNICFTGGEPSLQIDEIYEIINILNLFNKEYTFEIETNGTNDFDIGAFNTVNVSPKIGFINYNLLEKWSLKTNIYFKFVIDNDNELETYLALINHIKPYKNNVIFMPKGTDINTINEVSKWLVKHCLDNNIRFSTRLHILLGLL